MNFPSLLRTSKNLQETPRPDDFDLGLLLNTMFPGSIFSENSIVSREDVMGYARNLWTHPETDIDVIRSRQSAYTAVASDVALCDFLSTLTIPKDPVRTYLDSPTFDRARSEALTYFRYGSDSSLHFQVPTEDYDLLSEQTVIYADAIKRLETQFPSSSDEFVNKFKEQVSIHASSEKFRKLETAITDIASPSTLTIKTTFDHYTSRGVPYYHTKSFEVEAKFQSGNTEKMSVGDDLTHPAYNSDRSSLRLPFVSIFATITDIVKEEEGVNLEKGLNVYSPIEFIADLEKKTIHAKIKIKKGFWRWSKEVTKTIDLTGKFGNCINNFSIFHEVLSEKKYGSVLAGFKEDIAEFRDTAIELQYLAGAARYMREQQQQGYHAVMPTVASLDMRVTTMTELYNPLLFGRVAQSDIVGNDVISTADHNAFVVVGAHTASKTTYMNGIGLAQTMMQAGLPVFAESAIMSPVDCILTSYVTRGSVEEGTSRHVADLEGVREISERITPYSLVLVDEIGTGTSPEDGYDLLQGIVRSWGIDLGAKMFLATHYRQATQIALDPNLSYGHVTNLYSHLGVNQEPTYKVTPEPTDSYNAAKLARDHKANYSSLTATLLKREIPLRH
ncbi:MAG: hypothetical protein WC254_07165 [Candidatus Woesearchaeota archaeon]|jgi:DNA mismatch repair ATPase MutS